ncbi:MAG: hypothetical protein Q7T40_12155 [Methylobacter sp.]|nr:hypothetical protein [Methylobacter sp.]
MSPIFLETPLRKIFAQYHAPSVRYRHLAFSSKDVLVLDELATVITKILPGYTVWDGNQSTAQSPISQCSRSDFIQQTFDSQQTGLIIVRPDEWLRHWPLPDKQAFWSALSTRHGGHHVVVVFSGGNDFAQQNNHYFVPHELQGTAITLWVSSKTQFPRLDK